MPSTSRENRIVPRQHMSAPLRRAASCWPLLLLAGIVGWSTPAAAASNPKAITVRVHCSLLGVNGTPDYGPDCDQLEGWFNGRLDWTANGQTLFQEYGPFFGVKHQGDCSNDNDNGDHEDNNDVEWDDHGNHIKNGGCGEVVLFLDGNNDNPAGTFNKTYVDPTTSILITPDLSFNLYTMNRLGQYLLVSSQRYMPVASALWSKHSEDTVQVEADIAAETAARIAGDNNLQNELNAEIAARKAGDTLLTNNLNSEITRATNAENGLQTSITNEVNRATAAEQNLSNALAQETANRIAGDTMTLNTAMSYTDSQVAKEAARAIAAEAGLSTSLTNEVNRAINAENGIQTALNNYETLLSSPGSFNNPGNPVDWTELKNVPPLAPAQGSPNYIHNQTNPQVADFNVTGGGTIGTLTVTGTSTLDSTLTVAPSTDVGSVVVKQTTAANPSQNVFAVTSSDGSIGYLTVDKNGNVNFADNINVSGNSTFQGGATYSGNGSFGGTVTVGQNLNVSGNVTGANGSFSGNVSGANGSFTGSLGSATVNTGTVNATTAVISNDLHSGSLATGPILATSIDTQGGNGNFGTVNATTGVFSNDLHSATLATGPITATSIDTQGGNGNFGTVNAATGIFSNDLHSATLSTGQITATSANLSGNLSAFSIQDTGIPANSVVWVNGQGYLSNDASFTWDPANHALSVGSGSSQPSLIANGSIQTSFGVTKGSPSNLGGDLGLYSNGQGGWERFVTNGGDFIWSASGNYGDANSPIMHLTQNGNLSVAGAVNAASFTGDGSGLNNLSGGNLQNGSVPNSALAHSSITVTTASGLAGGGNVSLGGSLTLSIPSGGVTNAMLAGGIENSKLVNSSVNVVTAAGSGLVGGGNLPLGGTLSIAIPAGGVTNAMLANSSVNVNYGPGLSGDATVALGGTLNVTNTGVLTVGAGGVLSSSGGQNPSITLTGIVPIANGGTGLGTGPSAANQFLGSDGSGNWVARAIQASDLPAGNSNYIQNGTTVQPNANFNISGNGTLGGLLTANAVSAQSYVDVVVGNLGPIHIGADNGPNNLYTRGIAFPHDPGDDANAGKIAYKPINSNALDIYGAGASNVRKVRLWDNVEITNSLLVDGPISGDGSGISNLSGSKINSGVVSAAYGGTGLAGAGGVPSRVLVTNDGVSWTAGLVQNSMLQSSSVTVTAGAGLSGGGPVSLGSSIMLSIPNGGVTNAMLQNSTFTVPAGAGLSGGGTAALGSSPAALAVNLNHDSTLVGNGGATALGINLGNANTWSASQTFNAVTNAYGGVVVSQATGGGLGADQGGSLELGANNTTASAAAAVPYIDFHYGIGSPQDYNVRVQNSANNTLSVTAASGSANVSVTGNVTASSYLSAPAHCVGTDCRTSWNNQDANSVNPMPRTCPTGQIAVSTGSYRWTCSIICAYGSADCNNNANDGCETNIATSNGATNSTTTPCSTAGCTLSSPNNIVDCGSCGGTCQLTYEATSDKCSGGGCVITSCNSGYSDCNNTYADGCEWNLVNSDGQTDNSINHCGSCTGTCPVGPNQVAHSACSNSTCGVTACNCGYADCNHTFGDGCEINIATDPNNCGGCGVSCSSNNMATRTCGTDGACGGVCNGTCAAGYGDCNNNKQTDGCESNLTNSDGQTNGAINHCGTCGGTCPLTSQASGTACASSACTITSCNANYYDVNGQYSDGCECFATGVNNACGSDTVATLSPGAAPVTRTGILPGGQGTHIYAVSWNNNGGTYTPHVVLSGAGYVMDIGSDCNLTPVTSGANQACNGSGQKASATSTSSGITEWDALYSNSSDPNGAVTASCTSPPAGQCNAGAVFETPNPTVTAYVRVRATSNTQCSSYTITFENQ